MDNSLALSSGLVLRSLFTSHESPLVALGVAISVDQSNVSIVEPNVVPE